MRIRRTLTGIAAGTSLAAFVTLGVPAKASASELLASEALDAPHASSEPVGDKKGKKDEKKKDEKKKDDNKKDDEKDDDEGSCGEGSCGEGSCGAKKGEKKK